jgi:YrbI family 3-deoxy-D-manno-octulosonate 8-phosphate phosphatase
MMERERDVLAIIPARGGSKGIPHKNIAMVGDKPLLAYTVEHAKQTPSINRVIVSTDDQQIGDVARQWGAEVVLRPESISGDAASSESALLYTLDRLLEEGYEPHLVAFLQATSPSRQPDDLQNAIDLLLQEEADSLFSACPMHGFAWRVGDGHPISLSYDYHNRLRRQEAPEEVIENGSIYLFRPWVLRKMNNRLGGKIAVYRMHPLDSLQVDEPGDLETMEQLLSARRGVELRRPELSGVHMLALDFDGVMTDNRVLVDQNGVESVYCSRSDGWGITRLKEAGIEVVVISTEVNPVVTARCRKLDVRSLQGCADKLTPLRLLADELHLGPQQVAYMGNDVNDLECLRWVGYPIAVADAAPQVLEIAGVVTTHAGGQGAVREVCDLILPPRQGEKNG